MLALQHLDNFNNITHPFNASVTMERTLLSPQGNYLLRYDPTSVKLYDVNLQVEIPLNMTTTFLKAQWTVDESGIIFTNLLGIFTLSLNNSSVSPIIAQNAANYITDFQLNPNATIFFYLNKSQLNAINFLTRAPLFLTSNSSKCNATVMKYDQPSNTIITSSLASGQSTCFICKWTISNNSFINQQFANLSICVINDIYIFDNFIALTKKKFNFNFMNTIILDLSTLSQITKTSQAKSNSNPAFIVPFHNYFLQYFSLSNYIYIYRDNFTTTPFIVQYPFLRSIQYNPFKDCFYIFAKHRVQMINTIEVMIPTYNCAQVKGAVNNTSNYSRECECPNGMLFNKETFACQNSTCGGKSDPCICSYGKLFNSYNLKCQLSCLAIPNAAPTLPFGTPQQCQCESPFLWNHSTSDCSTINCSLISYSSSTSLSQSCSCTSGYSWDNQFQICSTSSDFFPDLVVIDLKNNTSNKTIITSSSDSTSSPAGLIVGIIVAVLLVLVAALFYYYKKCKNSSSRESGREEEEPRATDRQLTEMAKATAPTFQSNEHLKSSHQKSVHNTDQPNKQQNNDQLDNFSIEDQNQEKVNYFSQIQSNIDQPLA